MNKDNRVKMNKKGLSGWLDWGLVFLMGAIFAGIFGFGIISGVTFTIAKLLAITLAILFLLSVTVHVIKKE
jgi:uncharacterized membrane protein YtjA (UPF0391 family)